MLARSPPDGVGGGGGRRAIGAGVPLIDTGMPSGLSRRRMYADFGDQFCSADFGDNASTCIHPRDYLESGGIGVPSLRESTHLTHAWQPDSSAANPAAMIYLPIIDQYLSTHQYQHLSHSNRSRDIFRLLSQATRWGIPYSRATIRVRFQGKAEAHKNHDSLLPITLPLPLYNYLIILAHSHSSFTGKCGWCASCYVGGPFLKLQARSKGYLLTRGA